MMRIFFSKAGRRPVVFRRFLRGCGRVAELSFRQDRGVALLGRMHNSLGCAKGTSVLGNVSRRG